MDLRHYIAIIFRWWWLVILLAAIGAAASYGISQTEEPVYKATTTVMVGQSIQAVDAGQDQIRTSQALALTYADMARRQPVLQGVVETLGLDMSWRQLKSQVTAQWVLGTQLLEIGVEAGSPEEARTLADEIANQLILLSPTTVKSQEDAEQRSFVRQRLENLQGKIEAGQARIKTLEAAMAGSLSGQQVKELQTEISALEGLISNWENSYTQLLIFAQSDKSTNFLAVVEPAQGSSSPIRPQTQLNVILGGLVGSLLALGIILLLEYLDDTIKTTDDLAQTLGLISLGSISRIEGKHYPDKLIAAHDPFSPIVESYRMIRSNIQFMSVDQPLKSLIVTSSIPGEGKSVMAANLAVIMAQAGLKTIIVDADMRRPVQHEIFQVPNLAGLTDLLCSPEVEPHRYLRKTEVENLHVIPVGVLPPNPAELLGSRRMGQLIASLNELADIVIFDSPPALVVTDTAVLSNRVDGVLLVTKANQIRRNLAKQTGKTLEQAGAKVLGAVLNQVTSKKALQYYHHYYTSPKQGRAVSHPVRVKSPRRQWLPFFR